MPGSEPDVGYSAAAEPSPTPPSEAADTRHLSSRRDRSIAYAISMVGWVAVVVGLQVAGAGLHRDKVAINWQIDSIANLEANPFASTWYRHVQPPLYNLFIGSVLKWSPFPEIGTLYVLWMAALLACFVLLADLLLRLRVPPVLTGVVTVLALANPSLLSTMVVASYEIPLTMLLLLGLRLLVAYLDQPTTGRWLGLAAVLTTAALTRSLFHPLWILAVLGIVALLARPASRRVTAAGFAIPILLVGGWMVKNQVLFGESSTSSWFGFNMTRGITAMMTPQQVDAAIADGDVSPLARSKPWGTLADYPTWTDDCPPDPRSPSLSDPFKSLDPEVANYNNSCFLPVYDQAASDAQALALRYPGRYLSTRREPLRASFAMASVGDDNPGPFDRPSRTWMDRTDGWLLPVDVEAGQTDWNLPLLGGGAALPYRISLTLLAGFIVLLGRGAWATVRLVRQRQDKPRPWLAEETLWLVLGATLVMVVIGSALVEYGENGRFRAMTDPLLVALPIAMLVRVIRDRRGHGSNAERRTCETPAFTDGPAPQTPIGRPED